MEDSERAKILIRPAMLKDASMLAKLCIATFYETYSNYNTEKNVAAYSRENFSEKQIIDEISAPEIPIFVAEHSGKLVGYVQLNNKNLIGYGCEKGIELCRFYVDIQYQKLKIGKSLMNKVYDHALGSQFKYLWLGVWNKNENAISVYKHLGFEFYGTSTFVLGDDHQEDHIMIKILIP